MARLWGMDYTAAADCVAAGAKNSGSQRQNGAGTFNDTTVAWPIPVTTVGGRRGLTFTIPDNYRRYEFTPPDAINSFTEGQLRFFSFAFRLASGFPKDATYYQVISQIHAAPSSGSPPVAIEVLRGGLELSGGANKPVLAGGNTGSSLSYRETLLPTVDVDRWYDVVYAVGFSSDASKSPVTVWVDGVQRADRLVPCATVWGTDVASDGGASYAKYGIYHGETIAGLTLHESGHAIGETFADVDSRPVPALTPAMRQAVRQGAAILG